MANFTLLFTFCMPFHQIFLQALFVIISLMTVLWIISIMIRNVSIADLFWGTGFVVACLLYFLQTGSPVRTDNVRNV